MTPKIPPRVHISDPETRGRQGSNLKLAKTHDSEDGKSLTSRPEGKPHTSTQLAMVPDSLFKSSSVYPPKDGQQSNTNRRQRHRSPSSLHITQRQTLHSITPVQLLRSSNLNESSPHVRQHLYGNAPPPAPDPVLNPKSRSSPQAHTKFLQLLHFPWLSLQHRSAPLSQSPTSPPTSGKLRTRGVALLAWLLYPLCPFPAGATRFPTAHVAPTPPQGRGDFGGCP